MYLGSDSNTVQRNRRSYFAACGCVILFACSDPEPPPASDAVIAKATESVLQVRIVDANGAPLAGMVPVLTDSPSPLAKRVAQGSPVDEDGAVHLMYPLETWVYLRAADPNGEMMADGHVEIEPGESIDPNEPIELKMAAAASLNAELHNVSDAPIGNDKVRLVLFHPAHGEWWRAEGQTDASGRVTFSGLPAGVYALKLEMGEAGVAAIREAVLVAGDVKDVGVVTPQAGE